MKQNGGRRGSVSFDIERLHKLRRKVTRFLRKNPRRPGSESIHDLRTSTRNLETAFLTLGLHSQATVKRVLHDLREIRKCAGKVRDMDVLTADSLKLNQDGEQDCLVELLEYLGARRNKFAKKLRRVIETAIPQVRRDLKKASERMERILKEAQSNPVDSDAIRVTMTRTSQLTSELNQPSRLTRDNLHSYRLKVKELLNVLQLSGHTRGEPFLETLSDVKDAIGEWHDWEELIAIATELLDHGARCELIRSMRDTSNSRYEHAVSLIQNLRNETFPGQAQRPAIARLRS